MEVSEINMQEQPVTREFAETAEALIAHIKTLSLSVMQYNRLMDLLARHVAAAEKAARNEGARYGVRVRQKLEELADAGNDWGDDWLGQE